MNLSQKTIETEVARRAARHKTQSHLVVDYYRVRRKLAFPLPIEKLHLPEMPVSGLPVYPWATWLLWDLEERVHCLGWAGTWADDAEAKSLARRDLLALSRCPEYRQFDKPDLSLGHSARLMWRAWRDWSWLEEIKPDLEAAFRRLIDDNLPLVESYYGTHQTKESILAAESPKGILHNIGLIGTAGMALAAHAIGHPAAPALDRQVGAVFGAILDSRSNGFSEGVGYDGYIMDFMVHWLDVIGPAERKPFLTHPRFDDLLDESIFLSAPGDASAVAELGDVEPVQMPFHLSAHAKLLHLRPNAAAAWHLRRCRPGALKADALAALHGLSRRGQAPDAGALDAHYAAVLRSGWEAEDVAVAVSVSSSPMGHLHCDTGTLQIGTRGRWLISDPGYQQYLKRTEREFTLGVTAHNAPVINGQSQIRKAPRRKFRLATTQEGLWGAEVEMTDGFAEELQVEQALRTVWLSGRQRVVVADRLKVPGPVPVDYHWHGHPEAAWWVADGWARIYLDGTTLCLSSPQAGLQEEMVDRLPGSRGQLTLKTQIDGTPPVVWWVFSLGTETPTLEVMENGAAIKVDDQIFPASLPAAS